MKESQEESYDSDWRKEKEGRNVIILISKIKKKNKGGALLLLTAVHYCARVCLTGRPLCGAQDLYLGGTDAHFSP